MEKYIIEQKQERKGRGYLVTIIREIKKQKLTITKINRVYAQTNLKYLKIKLKNDLKLEENKEYEFYLIITKEESRFGFNCYAEIIKEEEAKKLLNKIKEKEYSKKIKKDIEEFEEKVYNQIENAKINARLGKRYPFSSVEENIIELAIIKNDRELCNRLLKKLKEIKKIYEEERKKDEAKWEKEREKIREFWRGKNETIWNIQSDEALFRQGLEFDWR